MAYFQMFKRDIERLTDTLERLNYNPLGACALAGTTMPIDRHLTSELLHFTAPTENAMDAVSDRDYSLEFLSDASISMMHLSRWAEEFAWWNSSEFSYIAIDDSFCTGIKWITVPLAYFAILGTDNGVNFTDGLDGLASSVTAVVAVFFTIASLALGGGIEPVTAAVAGALLGFLLFNVHPAQVFMGDTGSLALGGFVAGSAYMLRMPWIILVVGLIYLIEVLSVIIQVTYFKKTGGKRFFKMAPIHHHFELCGWSETRIVAVFSTVTMLLCIAGLLLIR